MTLLAEAFRRKNGETILLVAIRAFIALGFNLGFLAYCGYLIYQIVTDQPLLESSFEDIDGDLEMPQVMVVPSNPSWRITECNFINGYREFQDIPDCFNNHFQDLSENGTSIYLFNGSDSYKIAPQNTVDLNSAIVYYFYYAFNATEDVAYKLFPFVSVKLIHPSVLKVDELKKSGDQNRVIEKTIYEDNNPVVSLSRHSTIISFDYKEYRAIKSKSVSSVVGINKEYVNIVTLPLLSQAVPLVLDNTTEMYEGFFGIQVRGHQKEIKTEVRQNTLVNAVALAGGWYGIFLAAYLFIFGMIRTSPWGIVHYVPIFFDTKLRPRDTESFSEDTNSENLDRVDRLEALLDEYFLNMKYTQYSTYQASIDMAKPLQ